MAGEQINDNFAAYGYWRSNIDKYKIYRNFADKSLHELKEKTLVSSILIKITDISL